MRTGKNGFRRITAMICALALCASMMPTAVFAVGDQDAGTGTDISTSASQSDENSAPDSGDTLPEDTNKTEDEKSNGSGVDSTVVTDEENKPADTSVEDNDAGLAATYNAPETRAGANIYENADLGIYINVEQGSGGQSAQFAVMVDEEIVADDISVDGLSLEGNELTIDVPEGYDVCCRGIDGSIRADERSLPGNWWVYPEDGTLYISITTSKTEDDEGNNNESVDEEINQITNSMPCVCETHCDEESINQKCAVCMEDVSKCAGSNSESVEKKTNQITKSVNSYDLLSAEIQKAENHVETTITLDDDINITNTIEIPVDKNIVLNLNGHTISYTGNSYVSNFTVKGTLTLIGNGTISGGTGYSRETGSSRGGLIYVSDKAVLNIGLAGQESYNILLKDNRILSPGYFYSAGGGIYVGNYAVFNMYSGSISNNCVGDRGKGSGVYVESNATFNMYGGEITENHPTDDSDGYDGAVYLNEDAKFNMRGGKISNNKAGNGGGVYINNAEFHMYNGTISENLSRENVSAAAVFVKGDKSKFTMDDGLIDKNIAHYNSNNGAAIKLETGAEFVLNGGTISNTTGNGVIVAGDSFSRKKSNFVMNNGRITGNTTTGSASVTHESGAGVLVQGDSTFTMNGGEISGNQASASGGGVYVYAGSSTFTMNNGRITGNTAGEYGGGVGVSNNSTTTFNMKGGEITGNKAAVSGGGVSVIRGSFFRDNGVLCNNTATGYGDDILVQWVYSKDLKLGHVGEDWKLRCGHTITGWYQDGKWKTSSGADGSLDRWNASTKVDGVDTEPCVPGEKTYAQAIPNPFSLNPYDGVYGIKAAHGNQTYYTVTFDYNDGGTTPDDVKKVLFGTSVSKPKDPERTGYTFVGWYKQGSEVHYDFNSKVKQTTVLVAQWQKKSVLTYNLTGGTGADGIDYSRKEYPYGDTVTVLESPTKEGYTFVEWNTNPDGTGNSYQFGDEFTISEDITLYAQWTPNIVIKPANITINNNTNNNTTTVNVTSTAAAQPQAATAAIPQTGDGSQPLVWVTLVVVSGAALAGLAVYRKKRSDK